MPPVFAHGRLRLYLLKLLDEAPRHGYEVIRLLEERFQGLYAPSAGTVYPRLAKLETEGLVTHTTEGGRKVYSITDAGRAELAGRSGELADLELEIRESVAELAAEIRADVRGAAGDLRREMRAAASAARHTSGTRTAEPGPAGGESPAAADAGDSWDPYAQPGDRSTAEAWRAAKEEMRRARQEWREQARRAKDESRRARDEAQRARRQAKEAQERARAQAQEEVHRVARQVQEQVRDHFARGDWPTGVYEGVAELARQLTDFGREFGKDTAGEPAGDTGKKHRHDLSKDTDAGGTEEKDKGGQGTSGPAGRSKEDLPDPSEEVLVLYAPSWQHEPLTGDPARDLDRLLDRFRDDIRDAARDHGVTEDQLRDARRHLSTAAAHIGATLRAPDGRRSSGA
jgi:DNA-binding PadR family transcriptional regulator